MNGLHFSEKYNKVKKCEICGAEFIAKKVFSKYCSPKCTRFNFNKNFKLQGSRINNF